MAEGKGYVNMKIPRNSDKKIRCGDFDQKAYNAQYAKEHYERIGLRYKKSDYMQTLIEAAMSRRGMQSQTEYIKMAIEAQLKQDGIDIDKMRDMLQSVHNGDE